MRKSIKTISKRIVSIILTIMMILSMTLVGIVTTGAASIGNMSNVYVAGTMNDWSTSSWKLTAHDSNHYSGSFYLPYSATNYQFKLYIVGPGWSNHFSANGYWFTSSNTEAWGLSTGQGNDQIQCISSSSGYIKVTFDFYGDYSSNSRLTVTQSAVSTINASISASPTSIKSGETSTLTTSVSGGTGSYTTTYTVKDSSGTTVSGTLSNSNKTFTAPAVTSSKVYTITYTVQDKNCNGYSVTKSVNITVNPSNYTGISAKAQSTTNGTTFVDDSNAGTVTIGSSTVSGSTGTPVTATPKAGYMFSKWTSSNGSFTSATSANTTFKPSANNAVAIAQFKKIYNITVNSATNGSVSSSTNTCGAGDSYTITVTPDSGYTLGSLTINGSAVSVSSNKYTGKATSDIIVNATFVPKSPATVTVSSNNNELGTATATPSTGVYVGDTITLTATPTNGSFSKWTISGATINTGYTATSATVKVTVIGNVTATATFDEKTYEVHTYTNTSDTSPSSTISMKPTDEAGVFISTSTVNDNTVFTIKRLSDNYYAKSGADSSGYWIQSTNKAADVTGWASSKSNTNYVFRAKTGGKVYIVYDSNKDEVYLTTDPNNKKVFEVFAKDGTNRNSEGSFTANNFSKIGETVILSQTADEHTDYRKYNIAEDTTIVFTTTIEDKYVNSGFYVGGFCVNGKLVEVKSIDTGKKVFTSVPYTLTNAEAINNCFEITPIYYNYQILNNGDYIRFYVRADEVEESWGGTVAVDAYSYINGDSNNAEHLFGTYPGQPMVLNKNGEYTLMVPKYRYYFSDNDTKYQKDENSRVSGITMTSYHTDLIHHYVLEGSMKMPWHDGGSGKNYQTYDFADFVTISQLEDIEAIVFENKWYPKSAKDNDDATQSSNLGVNPATLTNVNPWQDFIDIFALTESKKTDVLGNILTDENTNNSHKLYVISQGNCNTQGENFVTKGQWATVWYIYDETGKFITKATPADFVSSTTAAYQAIVNGGYEFCETMISYDKEKYSNVQGDTGIRSDGRWYYRRIGQEINTNVEIEYKDDNGNFKLDTNTNTENLGGFIGQTTNKSTAAINNYAEATFTQVGTLASMTCNVSDGWAFVGWYRKDIKNNEVKYELVSNKVDFELEINAPYTIVARLERIPSGTLQLTHTKYYGTNPAYHTGSGDYYISAVVKDSNNNVISSVTESQTAILVPGLRADYSIEITLKTVCHGEDTFYAWYEKDGNGYFEIAGDEDPRGSSNASYTFTVNADMLFNPDGTLATTALNFYSDIVKVSIYAQISYFYYARYDEYLDKDQQVEYVVKNVELSLEEIANDYKPSLATISKYAPSVDTMYLDTEWFLKLDGKDKTVDYPTKGIAEVTATQEPKKCKVIAPDLEKLKSDPEDIFYKPAVDVVFNSWFADAEGNFILEAPIKVGDYSFARWEVYKLDAQGNPTDELVTVLTDRIFTLRIMADYLLVPVYNETPDRITAHISTPVYNREVFGDSTNPTDRLYVDFLVAFTSTDIPVFKENATEYTVECGIIVDRNNKLSLSADDRTAIVNAAKNNAANPLNINTYVNQFGTNYDEITRVAFDNRYVDKDKVMYDDANGREHRLTKYVFNNDQLTNKNRIDKVLVYTNNEANQNYIFAAYSYVIIRDISGNVIASAITTEADAQFYNLCYQGNMPYVSE